jgi:3'-5' exoribonuclease
MSGEGWQWSEYQRHLERYLYLRAAGGGEEAALSGEDQPEPFPPPPAGAKASNPPARSQALGAKRQQTLF